VELEDEEMITALLKVPRIETEDALLHAVYNNMIGVVKKICNARDDIIAHGKV